MRSLLVVAWVAGLLACGGDDGGGDGAVDGMADAGAGDGGAVVARTEGAGCGAGFEPGVSFQDFQPDNPRAGRTYWLHVPAGYDGAAMPLVLNLHGFVNDGAAQRDISGMGELADEEGFIVAFPEGLGMLRAWNAGDCCAWNDLERDDVAFLDEVIEHVAERVCVDRDRIYATGFSNGGFMAYRLACERSTTYAALASVSGVIGIDPAGCAPERVVPMLHVHGTADLIVPFGGGSPAGYMLLFSGSEPPVFRSVADTVEAYRGIAGCQASAEVDFEQGDTRCESHGQCDDGASYRVCTIEGGGHAWPGGDAQVLQESFGFLRPFLGSVSGTLDANRAIWELFEQHRL